MKVHLKSFVARPFVARPSLAVHPPQSACYGGRVHPPQSACYGGRAGSPGIPARCSEVPAAPGEQGCSPHPQAGKPALRSSSERGIALVVTLILLTVITFLAVAFLFLSRRERGAVSTAVDMTTARLAAEAATERAKAETLARIMATGDAANYDLLVSTNYFNPLGLQSGYNVILNNDPYAVTNVNFFYDSNGNSFYDANGNPLASAGAALQDNIANLFYSPRVPVLVDTNLPGIAPNLRGPLDFRFWLDLNRNGRFETNGRLPELAFDGTPILTVDTNGNSIVLSNHFVGDPEWVGLLERTDRPHGPNNKFISRMAFVAVPEGKTLDINTIHNQSKLLNVAQDGYSRNMGVGAFELNLAAFMVDLNTNLWQWNAGVGGYIYNTNLLASSLGTAFEDATALTRYRYGGGWNNLRSVQNLFGVVGENAFLTDFADGYGGGPLMVDMFLPVSDSDAPNRVSFGWPGAENPNHYINTQDLFDRNKTWPFGAAPGLSFSDRLRSAGFYTSTYDRYTYYRLLSQLGTDSGPEPAKLHLNYRNVDDDGKLLANAQTNFVPWTSRGFFTNAADRLLRATFPSAADNAKHFGVNAPLSLTNIPVLVSNRFVYTPALHRVFQLAVNILDSSTNYSAVRDGADLPSVFRPVFERRGTDVFIREFEEVAGVGGTGDAVFVRPLDLTEPVDRAVAGTAPNQNIYGVPWVIGAKKGLPNFNEFAIQSIAEVTRKLQIRKAAVGGRPTSTNQMFTVGISNVFAAEAWNSYRTSFPRDVDIAFANDMDIHFSFTNDARFDLRGNSIRLQLNVAPAPLSIPQNAWQGYGRSIRQPNTNSFIIPVYTNINFLPESVYRMTAGPNFYGSTNNLGNNYYLGYEQNLGFPIPQFTFAVSNRIRFIMLDRRTGRVLDYVQLNDLNGARDLTSELAATVRGADGKVGGEGVFWNTNRPNPNSISSPPLGVVNQIRASLGELDVADWNSYGQGQATGNTKAKEIDAFRVFMGLTPLSFRGTLNTNRDMQVPFTPTMRTSQYISWQANDPLVHFMAGDLVNLAEADSLKRELPNGPIQPIANIGRLNKRFEPWGGYPAVDASASPVIPAYSLEAKDPGIRASDDWDFPTNKYPTVGWLGRVHRGTPWQTIYLKSPGVNDRTWSRWSGNSDSLDARYSKPVNDRVIFDVFTTAFDENSTRGQLNVNQDGLAAWSAGLSGVIGITNTSTDAELQVNPPVAKYEPSVIQPAGVQVGDVTNTVVGRIWAGINRTRNSDPYKGSFGRTADILATPELTVASPLLNTNSAVQLERGINDAMYERLPQMLMGLLRGNDQPRFSIYAYGQALKPANRSIVTSGPFSGLCTNYQVTAEFATRTVVRIEGAPNNPKAVVESFNVLPPD